MCALLLLKVRGQLCTALSRVLLHGFKSFKPIGRYHIWDFVDASCEATSKRLQLDGQKFSHAEYTLRTAVVDVNSHEAMANNPNIKFRSFVCSGLNSRELHEWMKVRSMDKPKQSHGIASAPLLSPCPLDEFQRHAWSCECCRF